MSTPGTQPLQQPVGGGDTNNNNNNNDNNNNNQTPTPKQQKIAVVGAGISGVSTAYYLQQQGHDVLLIESLDDVAKGATRVGIPLLKRYQESIINFDVYDKIKSQFCPVRMFTRAQKLANTYSHTSFHDAYGWDIAKLAFDQEKVVGNTAKLSLLTQSNYNETLDLIRKERLPLTLTPGHLYVTDDRAKKGDMTLTFRQFKALYKDCDIFKLTRDEPAWIFPSLQQNGLDLYGGLYTPSTMVFHPTTFTQQLKNKIEFYNNNNNNNNNNQQQQQQQQTPLINPFTGRPYGQVEFLFNTKATGFTINQDTQNISKIHVISQNNNNPSNNASLSIEQIQSDENNIDTTITPTTMNDITPNNQQQQEQEQEIPIDQVVLCNGYQAFQITEHIDEGGPLLQVIPVKSVSFDVYDKTRARFDKTVPTLFPTHPISYYPEDQEFTRVQAKWEMDVREAGLDPNDIYSAKTKHPLLQPPKVDPLSVEEIHRDYTSPQPVPYSGLGAVEFSASGLTLVADQHNPRHFFGYLGRDMAEIGDQVGDKHLDNVLSVLEAIRKIPEGALVEVDPEMDRRTRRAGSQKTKANRHLSMQPSSMALHTVGRDGLPVIGPAAKVNNLFFNTGHGVSPHNTAVIGGKMVAQYCTHTTPLTRRVQQQARVVEDLRARGEPIPLPTLSDEDFMDVNTALGIKSIKDYYIATKQRQIAEDAGAGAGAGAGAPAAKTPSDTTRAPSFLAKTRKEIDYTQNTNLSSYICLRDYLPTRWPQHLFTPTWFEGAQLTREQQAQAKRDLIAKQQMKRQQVASLREQQ